MTLSKENCDKLNENYLYQREPIRKSESWTASSVYHCKNWTFKVHKLKNGRAFMLDTYYEDWDSHIIQVTNENIKDFKVVFDFREVKRIKDDECDEYDEGELYRVATSSAGWDWGNLYWVDKDVQKSKELLVKKKREEIQYLKSRIELEETELKRLLD